MNDSQPDLDVARLARMGAFDDPAIAGIIESFLNTLDERIAGMESAAAEGDYKRLLRLAHQLRGSAANCGFSGLAALCNLLDRAPNSFDIANFRTVAARARTAWEHSLRF